MYAQLCLILGLNLMNICWICADGSARLNHPCLPMRYSKTCVKWPLSKRPKIVFQDQLSLDAGQKYCRMLQLSTFIKLPFVIRYLFCVYFWVAILRRFYCIHVPESHEQAQMLLVSSLKEWKYLKSRNNMICKIDIQNGSQATRTFPRLSIP